MSVSRKKGNKNVSKFLLLVMRGNWIFIGFDDCAVTFIQIHIHNIHLSLSCFRIFHANKSIFISIYFMFLTCLTRQLHIIIVNISVISSTVLRMKMKKCIFFLFPIYYFRCCRLWLA